ncbi:MAG: hypothetical protein KatS3mg131_2503 [Candidatus Tectimicrobiota bacterium]|nr:MAG: hypothetical protein KatS3mg131_2503 [Candidatus Tectomicrobia bacterium]
MAGYRQQLFQQFAAQGIAASIEAFKATYQPKKENRFHFDGVTYEIGPAKLNGEWIEFEISSKIPQDELTDRGEFEQYFEAICALMQQDDRPPSDTGMDSIVHELGQQEVKERDYVRLVYRYRLDEMYSDEAVAAEVAKLRANPQARSLPDIPGVYTLAGRVVLRCVEDFMRQEATRRMERLIEANQEVRKRFGVKTRKAVKMGS